MVGAGARDEEAARLQQLQGAKIDLLVAAMSRGDAIAILGEGRWVQDDHLEFAAHIVVLLQDVEGIAFAKSDVGDGIQFLIAARGCDRGGSHVNGFDVLAVGCDRESEAAVVTEAIEHFAGCVAASGQVVLALVEERAGLLSFRRRSYTKLIPFSLAIISSGTSPCSTLTRLVEAFEQAHLWIIAFEDAFRREEFDQDFDEEVLQAVSRLAQRLYNEIIAVAIDDERRQMVRFAVDEPKGIRVLDNDFAVGGGAANAFGEESRDQWARLRV